MHGTDFSKTKYCPYCMSRLTDGEVCPVCGLTRGNYQPQPHHLPPGTVLVERYMVGRVLGEGGFGITYIGRDMRMDYRVAIKEYLPSDQVSRNTEIALDVTRYATVDEATYEKGLQRFLNEARTLALMFKQPQIVTVHDFFEANGTAYIVMEYVDGTTFADLVRQYGGRIAPEELFPMIEPLFGALANVHKQGILHRDISPDNLMLENGNVRLLDFGSAREVQPTGQQTMTIALKKGYGTIEQYQGKGQGPWTDVYALSATIYYCLTGVKPPDAVERILDDELVPPRELGVDMPQWQEQALLYGMSVNPTKRYRTMDAMHAGLYLPLADTIVPSPAVLGGVAVLEAGFAPEEAQAQALSQAEEKQTEALPQTEVNQAQENQDEALPQSEVDQTQAEANQTQVGVNLSQNLPEEEEQPEQALTQNKTSLNTGNDDTNTIMQDDLVTEIQHSNTEGIDAEKVDSDFANSSVESKESKENKEVPPRTSYKKVSHQKDAAITDTENKDGKDNLVETGSREKDKEDGARPVATAIKADDDLTAIGSQKEDTTEEFVTADHRGRFLSYISTHRPLTITAGVVLVAVVALAIVLAVLIPRLGPNDNDPNATSYTSGQDGNKKDDASDADGQDENEQDDVEEQEPETEESVDYDALFTSEATVYYDSDTYRDTNFQISMTLESVPAIVLSGSIEMDRENIVIDKPVLIEEDIWANVFSHVTVTGDGILYVKGDVSVNGMMDVTDGGQIVVADSGELDVDGLLWLQDEDSCVLQDGSALVLEDETYTSIANAALERSLLVLDENALTAYATYVTTTAEFQQAESSNASAIIIDADMTFTGDVNQGVPVIISEGVTVTMEGTWFNRENVFINHGTFNGNFQGGDWADEDEDGINEYEPENSLWRLLNYGAFNSNQIYTYCRGTVVNGGQFEMDVKYTSDNFDVCYVVFCNLGDFDYGNGHGSGLRLCNYGTCNVVGDDSYWEYSASILNLGTIRVVEGAYFNMDAYVENRGKTTVEDGASGHISGLIVSNWPTSAITVSTGAELWGDDGMVIYGSASTLDFQGSGDGLDSSSSFRFSYSEGDLTCVNSAEDLANALGDDASRIVAVKKNISYGGNLDFTDHVLVLDDGARLTVDGDVTTHGDGAVIYLRGGSLDMGGHTLTLSDGAILLFGKYNGQDGTDGEDDVLQCGTLDVQAGGKMVAAGHWSAEGIHLITDGRDGYCRITTLCGVSLQDCVVDIGEESRWCCGQGMVLSASTLNVDGEVWAMTDRLQVSMDADTVVTIAESGRMVLHAMDSGGIITLDGTIENYGNLRMNFSALYVQSGGILNNYHSFGGLELSLHLAGTLHNEGEVVFKPLADGWGLTDEGGSYSGDNPIDGEGVEEYDYF